MKKNSVKNIVKAIVYAVLGSSICATSIWLIVYMYISSDFLPVYVGSIYVIGNQIVRYTLYIILVAVAVAAVVLAAYGVSFLIKKFHKVMERAFN